MDEKFIEKLAALLTIAGVLWFVMDRMATGKACCAKCKGGGRKGRGFGKGHGGGGGGSSCGSQGRPPASMPVSYSDAEDPVPAEES